MSSHKGRVPIMPSFIEDLKNSSLCTVFMDVEYWLNLDVIPSHVTNSLKKNSISIQRKLGNENYLPGPIQTILREKTESTLSGLDLVKYAKETKPAILEELIAMAFFCKQKGIEYVEEFSVGKLSADEIGKCKTESSSNRLALVKRLYDKNPELLLRLHWEYLISKRDFVPYSLGFPAAEFADLKTKTRSELQIYFKSINSLKKNCHCWHILDEGVSAVLCIRAFPVERIVRQVKRNTSVSVAKTYFIRIKGDGSIELPSGSRVGSKRIAQLLARKRYGEDVKFDRTFYPEKIEKLGKLAEKILSGNLGDEMKITSIELLRAPWPGNPVLTIENEGGLHETIEHLADYHIALANEGRNISRICFSKNGKPIRIAIKPHLDGEIIAICHTRWLSDENRKEIQKLFKDIGIELNFGSEKL